MQYILYFSNIFITGIIYKSLRLFRDIVGFNKQNGAWQMCTEACVVIIMYL